MAEGFYKEVAKLISQHGFKPHASAKGSHEKWKNDETGKILLVPRNLYSRHTANGILKDAGIGKKF